MTLPVAAGGVRVLVCDADGTLLPCAEGSAAPDPDVLGALGVLGQRFSLGLVSAARPRDVRERLLACGMGASFPEAARHADEPDGAGYRRAVATQGCFPDEALAVVGSAAAARAAVRAGLVPVGNLQYVAPDDRPSRTRALAGAGTALVVTSWEHLLVALLG